jgi:hypothetical protein
MNTISKQPLAGFERRLLDELTQIDAQRPSAAHTAGTRTAVRTVSTARQRRMRPALIGASLTALVAGAIYLGIPSASPTPALHGGGPQAINTGPVKVQVRPAAFTLTKNGDGTVTFTAHDLVDTDAATKALNDAGIAGRVLNAQTQSCSGTAGDNDRAGALLEADRANGNNAVTFSSSHVPTGGGLLIVVNPNIGDLNTSKSLHVWVIAVLYGHADKIPTCVDLGGGSR